MGNSIQRLSILYVVLIIIMVGVYSYFMINYNKLDFLIYDDAFYYFDLVQDGSVINPTTDGINKTTGYHPLWFFILDFLSMIGISGYFASTLATSILLLCSSHHWFFVFNYIYKDKIKALLSSVIMHTFPPILFICYSGMEAPLVLFSLGLFLHVLSECHNDYAGENCHYSSMALSMGLLFLARTDMIILIVPLAVYVLIRAYYRDGFIINPYKKPFKKAVRVFVIGLPSLIVAYLLWNKIITGVWTQTSTTIYSKIRSVSVHSLSTYFDRFKEIFSNALQYYEVFSVHWIFLVIVLLVGWFSWKKKGYLRILLLSVIAYTFIHIGYRFCFSPWYIIPMYGLFALALVQTIKNILFTFKKNISYIIVGGILMSLVFMGTLNIIDFSKHKSHYLIFDSWTKSNRSEDQIAVAYYLSKNGYNYNIGGFNTGEFSYMYNKAVNLDGLMNIDVIYAYRNNRGIKYLRDNDIYVIVDNLTYFQIFSMMGYIPIDSLEFVANVRAEVNEDYATTAVYKLKDAPITKEELLSWLN